MSIVCKSASEIEKMRRSGRIVRQVLDSVRDAVAPGVTTMDLERIAEKKIGPSIVPVDVPKQPEDELSGRRRG